MTRALYGAAFCAAIDVLVLWFVIPVSTNRLMLVVGWFGACNYLFGVLDGSPLKGTPK